ncbi:hypothetical protein [Tenacibaculum piscium]|uniref:hypothetical protein n=1 Tax=Tenacibaculum piscium TaxID=1458515 RepID=UPI001F1F850C|nr:hypothetical protein [Tenacibaculum piscium]
MKYFTVIFLVITSVLIGCKNSENTTAITPKSITEKVVVEKNTEEKVMSSNTHQVVVLEKIDAGGYVYLKVSEKEKEEGKQYWIAVPGKQVKIGATYYYDGGMEMRNFESKTLKRTFDRVIFAQGIRDEKKKINNNIKNKTIKKNATTGKSKINIEKATNGIRIAQLFENPKAYQNKEVSIKGQAVKVNNGIMGVNFIHLQDGTTGNGQYDITVTSNESVKIGDIITLKGTVILNKDFGAGYVFDVLIEKAVVLK